MGDVTQILSGIENGDAGASEALLPLVYDELRRLAAAKMAHEQPEHTLQPTALVHEAYLRLVGARDRPCWDDRRHFYAAAAEAMRRILVDSARRKSSLKRGGGRSRVEFSEEMASSMDSPSESLLALDAVLKKLEREDAACFKVVMLRYFGGLTFEETAEALSISLRTAKRYWSFARAWLQREMDRE
jgi:RNA polymerase sigma factor (TIGR02999 family)